jgi:hypothetical protein
MFVKEGLLGDIVLRGHVEDSSRFSLFKSLSIVSAAFDLI